MCRSLFAMFTLLAMVFAARAQQAEPVTIAVSDLLAQGVSQSEAAVLSEQLRVAITRSPHVRLIERGQMQEILNEQGFQQSGCTSDQCAVEIGQLLGVKNMVLGTVGVAGSYTVLSVRVIDVSTGSVLANESVQTRDGINDLLESGIDQVATLLSAKLSGTQAPAGQASDSTASRRSPARAILIGGGAAVLVGAGVVVAILLSADSNDGGSDTPDANTRITLP